MDISAIDQLRHLAVKEGEQQCADMAAVDIRIRHQQDLVVARARDVEIVLAFFGVLAWSSNAGPKGLDQRTDLLAVEHFFEARPLDVQNLPLQRQDRLESPLEPLLG